MNALMPILTSYPDMEVDDITESSLEQTKYSKLAPNQTSWRISKIRKSDLPLKRNIVKHKDSSLGLTDEEGLNEPTHFIIFDGKIVIGEFNLNGLRFNTSLTKRGARFFKEHHNLVTGFKGINLRPMLRMDIYDLIDKYSSIFKVNIEVATNYAQMVSQADDSLGDLLCASKLVDDMNLNLSLSLGRRSKEDSLLKFENVIPKIKSLVSRDDYNRAQLIKAEIEGILNKDRTKINFVEALMIEEVQVAKLDEEKTKAIKPNSMYAKILRVYRDRQDEIQKFLSRAPVD